MKRATKIIIFMILSGLISVSSARAFFPIPVPLIGNDIANNAADLGENLNAIGELYEQTEATVQKATEEIKSGDFGFGAIKNYVDTVKKISIDKILADVQAPDEIAKDINDTDKTSKTISNMYVNGLSAENQMEQVKQNQQKRTELLQMNVASMYAHALATRVHLAKEREMPETTLDSENTREILQGNRAMAEKIVKRWNDILFMEAQNAEYEATKILTNITLDSGATTELQNATGKE